MVGEPRLLKLGIALFTVNELLPLLAMKFESPAKLALRPLAYVFALMPDRLTLFSVATPLPFVAALPTFVPLSMKPILLFATPDPFEVKVAARLTMPA